MVNKYKHMLEYFDAYKIGLTATPANFIDRNSYQFFHCPKNRPTVVYDFYDAVDYMIYDELEKSVYEVNKRRPTVMIQDQKRSTLPALKPKASINIFKILKDSIGKDLSKF
mgnify:CR=1 FL=1